ncbi:MAG: cell division protein ZapE [Gammaproteobacteria bacterium]
MSLTQSTQIEKAWQEAIASGRMKADPAQASAIESLARLERELTRRRLPWRRQTSTGVYLYGPVGRGKTCLMDFFYRNLPLKEKIRRHFHAFMQEEVHEPLRQLHEKSDPLFRLARDLARRVRVICFDEFLVEDIADAMLLGPLFEALFDEGVALVATANVPPADLYRDGLQRERFLPAIAALEKHCEVVTVAGTRDYRAEHIGADGAWHMTDAETGRDELAALFQRLTGECPRAANIAVNGREIHVAGASEDTLLLDFATLCTGPRSATDYIALAERYRTILLAGVPILDDEALDATRRFIALVDVLYENCTVLVVAAAAQPEELYRGKRFRFEFLRSASRLEEMRGVEWFAAIHLARTPALTPL